MKGYEYKFDLDTEYGLYSVDSIFAMGCFEYWLRILYNL